ncbi:MAG: histidinol dehydrogenase [Candidatus Margulisiibacteriota bacterium]|jgi:histidinol dehydrogenase
MLNIITGADVEGEVKKLIARKSLSGTFPEEKTVKEIIDRVRKEGDAALIDYSRKFDGAEILPGKIKISEQEIKEAYNKVKIGFLDALTKAIQNITAFHKKQQNDEWFETLPQDVILGQRLVPLERVGVYVPGGRAVYPSSVVMNVVPAKVAGVKEIILVSPPPISPYVLVAANEVGVNAIYQVGGAQAIAALAYGTESIPQVDKIVGPGNVYVMLAKKQVFGVVGIESLAGPSDVLIVADDDAFPEFIAADLLAQAEHGPGSVAILMTTSKPMIDAVQKELAAQKPKLLRQEIIEKAEIYLFHVESLGKAIELSNKIAPEHLGLEIGSPQRVLEKVKNAGAVFLGPHSPVAVGDYIAGPNHVLPTGGTARFSSPLGVYDFIKHQSIIGYTKPALKSVWKDVKFLSEIEGLDAHGRSMDVRFS